MKCPKCGCKKLKEIKMGGVEVNRCEECFGLWFDKDELKIVRDHRDENLSWLNFDLWKNKKRFSVSAGQIRCPIDKKPLFKIKYGNTNVMVDICLLCRGIWLDNGELEKIISDLREKISSKTIPEYIKEIEETMMIMGREGKFEVELKHIMIIMKLIEYRIIAQHPKIAEMVSVLPS